MIRAEQRDLPWQGTGYCPASKDEKVEASISRCSTFMCPPDQSGAFPGLADVLSYSLNFCQYQLDMLNRPIAQVSDFAQAVRGSKWLKDCPGIACCIMSYASKKEMPATVQSSSWSIE